MSFLAAFVGPLTHVDSSPTERSVLAASMGPYRAPRNGFGRGGHTYGRGRRDQGRGPRQCTVDRCWDLHGHLATYQASISVFADSTVSFYAEED